MRYAGLYTSNVQKQHSVFLLIPTELKYYLALNIQSWLRSDLNATYADISLYQPLLNILVIVYNCREHQLVHIVVDPLLSKVLRPHQREVSMFGT